MSDIARKVRMTVNEDHTGNTEGVQRENRISQERYAPDAIDAICQEVAKFTNYKRTDKTMDVYLMKFNVLREKVEARVVMGSGFPDESASFFSMQNAPR